MFKTSEEAVLKILESMAPTKIFAQVPVYVDYKNIKEYFIEDGYYCVDLHESMTRKNIIKNNIRQSITNGDKIALIGWIESYDDILELFSDEDFGYIFMFPNNKKYVSSYLSKNEITEYFNNLKKIVEDHSHIRNILMCLV